jgi:hypothetical protein
MRTVTVSISVPRGRFQFQSRSGSALSASSPRTASRQPCKVGVTSLGSRVSPSVLSARATGQCAIGGQIEVLALGRLPLHDFARDADLRAAAGKLQLSG